MSFKKHNWMRYGRTGEIVEIKVRGERGGQVDFFRVNNNKDSKKIGRILKEKYGFDFTPEIDVEDSVNFKEKEKKIIKEEIDWVNSDF